MIGTFWIDDLEKTLEAAEVYDLDAFNLMFEQLPPRSKIKRWYHSVGPSKNIKYISSIKLFLTGYFDESGRDIYLKNNVYQRPYFIEEIPFKDLLIHKIAKRNNVSCKGNHFFVSSQINNLNDLTERIKAVKTAEKELAKVVMDFANKEVNKCLEALENQ